jgi:predicted aspartyl protease
LTATLTDKNTTNSFNAISVNDLYSKRDYKIKIQPSHRSNYIEDVQNPTEKQNEFVLVINTCSSMRRLVTVPGTINDVNINCLIDTGATSSSIKNSFKKANIQVELPNNSQMDREVSVEMIVKEHEGHDLLIAR